MGAGRYGESVAVVFSCTITEDDVLRAWRSWLGDPAAELPPNLLADVSASFVSAAMEDAALVMLRVLLVDRVMEQLEARTCGLCGGAAAHLVCPAG